MVGRTAGWAICPAVLLPVLASVTCASASALFLLLLCALLYMLWEALFATTSNLLCVVVAFICICLLVCWTSGYCFVAAPSPLAAFLTCLPQSAFITLCPCTRQLAASCQQTLFMLSRRPFIIRAWLVHCCDICELCRVISIEPSHLPASCTSCMYCAGAACCRCVYKRR